MTRTSSQPNYGKAPRARDPLQVNLRWLVYLILLVVIVPTFLVTGVGVLVVTHRNEPLDLIFGILVTAFALSIIAGASLLLVLARRGARLARIQETFLSHMGHELLTPLAGIRLHSQLLERSEIPEQARASVTAVTREARRLEDLVQRSLRWREIRSSGDLYRRRRTNPQEILEKVRSLMPRLEKIRVRVSCPDVPLRGDPDALAEAIGNLLANAFKYGGEEDSVELTVRNLAGRVIFVVSDRGPGLPGENVDNLFEPFQRQAPRDGPDPGGSGLGLTITRQIAKAHRGDVGVVERRDGGTRFFIHVPVERRP